MVLFHNQFSSSGEQPEQRILACKPVTGHKGHNSSHLQRESNTDIFDV